MTASMNDGELPPDESDESSSWPEARRGWAEEAEEEEGDEAVFSEPVRWRFGGISEPCWWGWVGKKPTLTKGDCRERLKVDGEGGMLAAAAEAGVGTTQGEAMEPQGEAAEEGSCSGEGRLRCRRGDLAEPGVVEVEVEEEEEEEEEEEVEGDEEEDVVEEFVEEEEDDDCLDGWSREGYRAA